jgi:NitT/TauT family transport system substrate-binding protein
MAASVRVGVFSVVDSLPYFVIRDQGLDRRHGLRFEEETGFPGGAAVQDAMIADRVDIAPVVGTAPYLAAAAAGLAPGRVMAVAANSVADTTSKGIAIVANQSVKRWSDLEGRLIAVNALRSVSTPAVEGRLRAEGVRSAKLVEIAPPNMGLAVAGGEVAAAAMLEPFVSQSLLRGDGQLLGWVIGGSPFERMEMSMVVVRTALYRERPEAVTRYIRAHLDAARWIAEHPDDARLLVAKIYALTPEIGRRITLLRWPVDGRHDYQSLEQVQQAYVAMGIVKRPLDLRRVIDETALDQARKGSSP